MLIIVAIGGHALQDPHGSAGAAPGHAAFGPLVATLREAGTRHHLVLTHGSGPQVGASALREAEAGAAAPLDDLCAELQGAVGYHLGRALAGRIGGRPIATVITQVVVDPADPSGVTPSKPIGPVLDAAVAQELAARHDWVIGQDRGGWRRFVASPHPIEIVERDAIRRLIEVGITPICVGGGGIPVIRRADGALSGIDAVIDKDRTAVLLAEAVDAEALVFLTDVEAVRSDWPPPAGTWLGETTPSDLGALRFAEGSMGPKVEAACRFVDGGEVTPRSGARMRSLR